MAKTKEPFELVIHIDENGARATASYRIRHYDHDDPEKLIHTEIEGVTLEALGKTFPWNDFIPAATKAALLRVEKAELQIAALNTDLAAAKEAIKAKDEEIELAGAALDKLQTEAYASDKM